MGMDQAERISRLGKLEEFIYNLEYILDGYKSERDVLISSYEHIFHDGSIALFDFDSIEGMKKCEVCGQLLR